MRRIESEALHERAGIEGSQPFAQRHGRASCHDRRDSVACGDAGLQPIAAAIFCASAGAVAWSMLDVGQPMPSPRSPSRGMMWKCTWNTA